MLDAIWGDSRIPARIWVKVYVCPITGCWLWAGSCTERDYPTVRWNGATRRTHRVVYQVLVAEIPPHLELDHLCRMRQCVNPEHLEPVTHRINTLRGDTFQRSNSVKTECPAGHPYDGAYQRRNGSVMRTCSICARRNKRAYKQRRRQAGSPALGLTGS